MKQEYDDYLCKRFPELYAERNMSAEESCFSWGFSVGDGWYPIILGLSIAIQNYIDYSKKEREEILAWNKMVAEGKKPSWWGDQASNPKKKKVPKKVKQVVVGQVKEKFGTLRFYVDNADSVVHNFISLAETMSAVVCEDCGAPGTVGGRGWIRTQCQPCRDKQPKREFDDEV